MSNVENCFTAKHGDVPDALECTENAEVISPGSVMLGPCTPLHMDDAQLEAEFAYIVKCYAAREKTAAP